MRSSTPRTRRSKTMTDLPITRSTPLSPTRRCTICAPSPSSTLPVQVRMFSLHGHWTQLSNGLLRAMLGVPSSASSSSFSFQTSCSRRGCSSSRASSSPSAVLSSTCSCSLWKFGQTSLMSRARISGLWELKASSTTKSNFTVTTWPRFRWPGSIA